MNIVGVEALTPQDQPLHSTGPSKATVGHGENIITIKVPKENYESGRNTLIKNK